MTKENKNIDDLEYLSNLGFEKVKTSQSDIDEIKNKIRSKSFRAGNSFGINLVTLIIGAFIGIVVFYVIEDKSKVEAKVKVETEVEKGNKSRYLSGESGVMKELDTVEIVKENFVRSPEKKATVRMGSGGNQKREMDSIPLLETRPIDLNAFSKPIKEDKLKYVANSPVFYLHDMKITDYATLYFKRNRFVDLSGVPADQERQEVNGSHLKQEAKYYLHEEIARAMLLFKKGKYDQCIQVLSTVNDYNKTDINCDFYLAMCFYYKKNYKKAIELFDRCISSENNTFLQEAMFYRAVSLYDSGDTATAKALFTQIKEEGEFYAEKAGEYLK